jgi:CheY-like chemotaxis protein
MTGGIEGQMSDSTDRLGILIVDDDLDQIFLSQRLVEKTDMGFSVATAAGGPEAVAYLRQACDGVCAIPALVFLDIKMPEMDGFDVLRWIRAKEELSHVRVIILSSSDDPKDAKQATELGADGYLIKDPNPMVVASILRQVSANRVRLPLKLSIKD